MKEKVHKMTIQQQLQAEREEAVKQEALAAWRKTGGSDADFETAWPEIKRDLMARQIADDIKQAQLQSARFYRGRF